MQPMHTAQEAELMALTRDFTLKIRGVTGVLSLVSMITVYRFVSKQFGGIPIGECGRVHTVL